MIDIRLLREQPDIVKKNISKRDDPSKLKLVEDFIRTDAEYLDKLKEIEQLRRSKNVISQEINALKKEGKDASSKIKEIQELPEKVKKAEEIFEKLKEILRLTHMKIPNLLHESVPRGKDDAGNVVVKEWGKKPEFKFNPKSHVDIAELLGLLDTERASKISGSRFFFLKRELVLLDFALMKLALDILYKKEYCLIVPPFMIRKEPYEGVTDLADFEDVLYKIDNDDLYLIATSEHPIAAMHMNETLDEADLPLKYAGLSTCFRKEAGSHGKDTKGIFRVHQFNKIEQFIFSKPEDSWNLHEELLHNAEEIFQALELPYRIVNICTGDIGTVAAKKYDLEVWMPVQKAYREAVSCSNCTDYQARRLNIKFGKEGGKKEIVHTLNSTAIATSRAMVAIIENFQNEDGSITIPKALRPYMNNMKKIG